MARREQDSSQATCCVFFYRLIHSILENPTRLGPTEFWENFDGGKLTVIPQAKKPRPVGQKNLIYKLITSINGRKHDKALVGSYASGQKTKRCTGGGPYDSNGVRLHAAQSGIRFQ